MFDIIKCAAEPSRHGFKRFFSPSDAKIAECENLAAAVKHRNSKALVLLRDHAFDEGALRLIAEKRRACFLIDLGRLIRARGVPRAIMMSKLRRFLALCVKFNALYTFATFAEAEAHIRSPEEIEHIAMLLGLNRGQAKLALTLPGEYIRSPAND